MAEVDRELGRLAVARGLLSHSQVEEAIRSARTATPPRNLVQVLAEKRLISDTQIRDLMMSVGATVEIPAARPAAFGAGATFGRYEILSELGRGGMGAVYKALDTSLDRVVALKILSDRYIATEDDIHRFQRESKLAARLRHPHLVPVYEAGVHDGVPYFTMEFVQGKTFDEILMDEFTGSIHPDAKPRLTRDEKVRIMIKVAEAMHVAHRAGIIHRDLKPANIIIDEFNEPHVMDFGLAKELESITFLTSTGTAMGTPYYMPPEQARGQVRSLDQRTDVYAIGAVLYHALTLQLPFMENTAPLVLRKVLEEDPVSPRSIDPTIERALELIIFKAMSKDRVDRYPSTADLARDLERFLNGQPVSARGPSLLTRGRKWVKRHPTWAATGGVTLLLLLGFAMLMIYRPGRLTLRTDPPGAEVWIDGKKHAAVTPFEELSLPRGQHDIHVARPGYRPVTIPIHIAAGSRETRLERLEARSGRLSLTSEPSPVEVRLSGPQTLVVQTPLTALALPEGTYRAEYFRPQYQLIRRGLKITDRLDVREKVDLPEAMVWKYKLSDGIYLESAVADFDDDRIPDALVIARDGKIVALSGRDGHVIWFHDTRSFGASAPAISDVDGDGRPDVVLGVSGAGFICLRGRDGASRYFVKTSARTFVARETPDMNGDQAPDLYITCESTLSGHSGRALLALKPGQVWSLNLGARAIGAPWVGPIVVAVTEGRRVITASLDGTPLHSWDVPTPVTSWTVHGDVVYLVGGGEASAWELKTGKRKWMKALGATPTEATVDGDLLVSTEEGFLIAIGTAGSEEKWRFKADQAIRGAAMVADLDGDGRREILVGSDDRRMYVLDAPTGSMKWYYLAADAIPAAPVAFDCTGDGLPEIVFGSKDGRVLAVSMMRK